MPWELQTHAQRADRGARGPWTAGPAWDDWSRRATGRPRTEWRSRDRRAWLDPPVLLARKGTPAHKAASDLQGRRGTRGQPGGRGCKALPGDTGPPGPTGPQGTTGATGLPGDPGATGATGPQGATGATRRHRPARPPGTAGYPGPAGVPSYAEGTFTVTVTGMSTAHGDGPLRAGGEAGDTHHPWRCHTHE